MTRKRVWAALLFSWLLVSGCEFSVEKQLGIGESCRQQRECKTGLDCVNRLCVLAPQSGTPTTSDEEINANLPTVEVKPASTATDAGADGGADASTDGG